MPRYRLLLNGQKDGLKSCRTRIVCDEAVDVALAARMLGEELGHVG